MFAKYFWSESLLVFTLIETKYAKSLKDIQYFVDQSDADFV